MKKLIFAFAAALCFASCNDDIGPEYSTAAVFGEVTYSPEVVAPGQKVTVKAPVTSKYGLAGVQIAYYLDDDTADVKTTSPWYYTKADKEVVYSGTLPEQKAGVKVTFQLVAVTPYSVASVSDIYNYTVSEEETPQEPETPGAQDEGGL